MSAVVKTIATAKAKETLLKKMKDYWRNLFLDYRQMVIDLKSDIQDEPYKAMKWSAGLVISYLLFKNNPNEIDFKSNLKKIEHEMILVHEDCLNPKSVEHVQFLQRSYNYGVLHYRSLGLLSIMYTSEYNDECSSFKTQCSYLKPTMFSWPTRIVDVGLMGRWWNIFIKTTDYDVNI